MQPQRLSQLLQETTTLASTPGSTPLQTQRETVCLPCPQLPCLRHRQPPLPNTPSQHTFIRPVVAGNCPRSHQQPDHVRAVAAGRNVQRRRLAGGARTRIRSRVQQQLHYCCTARPLRAPQPLLVVEPTHHQAEGGVCCGIQGLVSTGHVQQREPAWALQPLYCNRLHLRYTQHGETLQQQL